MAESKDDKVTFEFDPYIAGKIQAMKAKKGEHVKMYINMKHNELKRKRKQERQNRKKNR